MALKERLTRVLKETTREAPPAIGPAVKICLLTFQSLDDARVWSIAEAFLALADRVYQEMEAERQSKALPPAPVVDEAIVKARAEVAALVPDTFESVDGNVSSDV
jgi:hypothetical protein